VPAGSYDLVITAAGRVNAVMTGVPVGDSSSTVIGSDAARIDTPASVTSHLATGAISVNGSFANTGGAVRALQSPSGGPLIEVGYAAADATTGAYGMTLPAGAPAMLPYAAGATSFVFSARRCRCRQVQARAAGDRREHAGGEAGRRHRVVGAGDDELRLSLKTARGAPRRRAPAVHASPDVRAEGTGHNRPHLRSTLGPCLRCPFPASTPSTATAS
jgi:hypothetical protein